jgi:hypothetical protein
LILARPLGRQVRIGSIGYLDAGQWIEVSTTQKHFGLALRILPSGRGANSFDASSGKSFKLQTYAKAEPGQVIRAGADLQARAELTFGRERAFVMAVKHQTVRMAGELGELMAAIRDAYHHRKELPESVGGIRGGLSSSE